MSWIEKIRNKSYGEKVRLIWIICIIAAICLIVLWVFTSKLTKNLPKDTSLFKTIGSGIKNINQK